MIDLETQRKVEQFLFHEARLLDAGEFEAWLALYEPEGIYWMPSKVGQTDPKNVASIIYEDHPILEIRVKRLLEARALVLTPMPKSTHLISNITVVEDEDRNIVAQSAFVFVQYQADKQKIFSGQMSHTLSDNGEGYRILLKRVDLLNCDGTLPLITIPV